MQPHLALSWLQRSKVIVMHPGVAVQPDHRLAVAGQGKFMGIEGVIDQYRLKYQKLTVVLTGGDTIFLAKNLKSSIFAIPNFLLEGLNSILIHNIDE